MIIFKIFSSIAGSYTFTVKFFCYNFTNVPGNCKSYPGYCVCALAHLNQFNSTTVFASKALVQWDRHRWKYVRANCWLGINVPPWKAVCVAPECRTHRRVRSVVSAVQCGHGFTCTYNSSSFINLVLLYLRNRSRVAIRNASSSSIYCLTMTFQISYTR